MLCSTSSGSGDFFGKRRAGFLGTIYRRSAILASNKRDDLTSKLNEHLTDGPPVIKGRLKPYSVRRCPRLRSSSNNVYF